MISQMTKIAIQKIQKQKQNKMKECYGGDVN